MPKLQEHALGTTKEGGGATAWIELHQSLPRHRKAVSAGHLLDVPRMSMIGHMVCLWTWALDNAPDGNLQEIGHVAIATGAEWEGNPDQFVDALIRVGFLDEERDALQIHNWDDYAGKLIARRKADRERKQLQRVSAGIPEDVRRKSSATVPYRTVPNQYIYTLRGISGWDDKGEPHLDALLAWQKSKGITDERMERSAIGLASVQAKTLKGYVNLVSALQVRINKGYDDTSQPGRTNNGRAGARFDNSAEKYIRAHEAEARASPP